MMELSLLTKVRSGSQSTGRGISRRFHIHGTNRNRIALHVMLNGRRNFTRRRWSW